MLKPLFDWLKKTGDQPISGKDFGGDPFFKISTSPPAAFANNCAPKQTPIMRVFFFNSDFMKSL